MAASASRQSSTDDVSPSMYIASTSHDSPFGANGKLTMRAEDHTLVDYALGWGELSGKEPFMPNPVPGNWKQIAELEAEMGPLYPRENRFGYSVEKLIAEGVAFFLLRVEGVPAGIAMSEAIIAARAFAGLITDPPKPPEWRSTSELRTSTWR